MARSTWGAYATRVSIEATRFTGASSQGKNSSAMRAAISDAAAGPGGKIAPTQPRAPRPARVGAAWNRG